MPWCDQCDKYVDPGDETELCSSCNTLLDKDDMKNKDGGVPWHFWIVVVPLVIYLLWRLISFILSLL